MFSAPDLEKPEENRYVRPQAGPWPKLPQTSRARNIFSNFSSKFDQNLTKFDQAGMSKFWGLLFFWKKNRRRPPGLGTQGVTVRPHRHRGLAWPVWPQVGTILKIKNGLIGPLTAPNDAPISSPSGKFRGGAKYGPPRAPKKN